MEIQLTKEQEEWLRAETAAGRFASPEQAVALALEQLRADLEDDYTWAKPLIDEGLADLAAGRSASWDGEAFLAEMHRRHGKDR